MNFETLIASFELPLSSLHELECGTVGTEMDDNIIVLEENSEIGWNSACVSHCSVHILHFALSCQRN